MEKPRNVFIVGPMGAGKTTVGKLLADELGLEFLDSDKEIEARTGADIGWIFDVEGEAGFRKREAAMIEELTARTGVLVATGGGAVLFEENRKRLVSRGTVIYLNAPLEQQIERTSRDRTRPLLRDGEPGDVLAALQADRGPLYAEVADFTFTADRRSAKALAQEIARALELQSS
ncbi:MAG: shikimate kinase AroK [Pseudomonadales bacterium]|jgi:shikimate kinase|nr:shikimate kinase AroK [Pseudomonadales bacterium]MDA0955377.1 shikimate kinase AroK [Pseudomonadota bacterium]